MFKVTHDPTGFWTKLSTFLKRHFTERDAAKVLKEFKKVKVILLLFNKHFKVIDYHVLSSLHYCSLGW